MAIIEIENLKKVYNPYSAYPKVALNNLSLKVDEGDFVCIMGASGSGKTTLISIMSTIDDATNGKIIIGDKNIATMNENEKSKMRKNEIGFIFQNYNLIDSLRIKDNILFSLRLNKINKEEQIEKLNKLSKQLGIEEILDKYPSQCSGGQQQRAAIARALIMEPKIIFADEPTGNLDSKTSAEVLGLMRKVVTEKNQTMVMVTHDNHLAGFADRIFHIIDGKIVKIEDRSEYKEDEQ